MKQGQFVHFFSLSKRKLLLTTSCQALSIKTRMKTMVNQNTHHNRARTTPQKKNQTKEMLPNSQEEALFPTWLPIVYLNKWIYDNIWTSFSSAKRIFRDVTTLIPSIQVTVTNCKNIEGNKATNSKILTLTTKITKYAVLCIRVWRDWCHTPPRFSRLFFWSKQSNQL